MRAVAGHVRAARARAVGEPRDLARLAEVLALAVDAQAGGQELGLQGLGPAAVGQALLRRLGGEADDESGLGRHEARAGYSISSSSVTGPSLTSSTSMWAPKTPPCAPRRSRKRS